MAQTTDYTTMRNVKVEISTDNTNWTNISGEFNSIENSGGEIGTGEVYTAEGDYPLVGIGKIALMESKLKVVYVETSGSAWNAFWDAYKNGTPIYVRYSPKGGNSGNKLFTSGKGFVTSPIMPAGEVSNGAPVTCELTFKHPGFTSSIIA
jgi:hypothetical protein